MVDPVVLAGQDDVPVLQEHDPAGKAEVRVGPLVDLVGHGYEDDEGKDVALPGTGLTQGLRGKRHEFVCHVGQGDQGHEAVVSIGLYEIMPGDCCGVNMVFPKGSDESLSNDGQLHRSPGVCSPVEQS